MPGFRVAAASRERARFIFRPSRCTHRSTALCSLPASRSHADILQPPLDRCSHGWFAASTAIDSDPNDSPQRHSPTGGHLQTTHATSEQVQRPRRRRRAAPARRRLCINQIVAARLRNRWIMASTPSTRHLLDSPVDLCTGRRRPEGGRAAARTSKGGRGRRHGI